MTYLLCDNGMCDNPAAYLAPRYVDGGPEGGIEWIHLCPICVNHRELEYEGPEDARLPILALPSDFHVKYQNCLRDG